MSSIKALKTIPLAPCRIARSRLSRQLPPLSILKKQSYHEMASTDVTQLPTLTDLYRNQELKASDQTPHAEPSKILNDKISMFQGDITKLKADSIVNAANSSLLGGGGIDGAIHRAAGPELLNACVPLHGCRTGQAKITDGFNLPSKKVIHAVGPNLNSSSMSVAKATPLLESCYMVSMDLAVKNDCKNIVFNCISTGVYSFPRREAASIAIDAVRTFLEGNNGQKLDKVIFCLFLPADVEVYKELLPIYFPPTKEDLGSV